MLFTAEMDLIGWLSGAGAWLTGPMKALSALGYGPAYLVMAALIYWLYRAELGQWLGILLPLGGLTNDLLKILIQAPRPDWLNPALTALVTERSFGFPSGHAQSAAVMWLFSAAMINRPWAWITGVGLTAGLGFSRLVLGAHFPYQVLVGWAIGGLVAAAAVKWRRPLDERLSRWPRTRLVGLDFLVGGVFVGLANVVAAANQGWTPPAAWVGLTERPELAAAIAPFAVRNFLAYAGFMLGVGLGLTKRSRRAETRSDGRGPVNLLVGLAGLAALLIAYRLLSGLQGAAWLKPLLIYLTALTAGWWVFRPSMAKRLR